MLDRLFREARTHNKWLDKPVPAETLHALYELLKWGPTSANCSPARFVFVTTPDAKAKLKQALSPGNVEKTMTAPVTVIVAHDLHFYDKLPYLFPHADARRVVRRQLQPGRADGLPQWHPAGRLSDDRRPRAGAGCRGDERLRQRRRWTDLFFAGKPWKSNFLINLGYGDPSGLYPRSPRLAFGEACEIV